MTKSGGKKPRLTVPPKASGRPSEKPSPRKPAAPSGARRPKRRRSVARVIIGEPLRLLFGLFKWVAWRVGILAGLALAASTGYFYTILPPPLNQIDGRSRGSVTMLDNAGNVFAWRGQQFGGITTSDSVSPYLKNAVVATEDKRFYHHFGISPRGVASAIAINLRAGRGPLQGNGGSTITQQVAKILCLGHDYDPTSGLTKRQFENDCRKTTVWRKLKEVPYAFAMELKYTKDEILTIYLNRVFLGAGSQGFEAASQRYFGKSARDVTPAEAALLAGLLVAPSYYAPTRNLARSQGRARVIINLMEAQGYLTPAEARYARENPAQLSVAATARAGGYFADWIMETGPSFLTSSTTEDVVMKTTFDPRIQKAAEEALADVFDTRVTKGSKAQAAIVVLSADGAIRAMVGGRKTGVSGQFNRATQALRQTGSSFKPFVYGAALDLGYRFDTVVEDAPLTIDIPGSGPWSPRNYSGKFLGPMTITKALAYSINTVAVRVSEDVGRDAVRTVAHEFGIKSKLAEGPALALGASESTLLEMTGAYAGILNQGVRVDPYGLIEVHLQGDSDPLMEKSANGVGVQVISKHAAQQLIYMMNQVSLIGSGRRAQLPDRQIAAKTGTTQGARDAWFIGFTGNYVAGVWMGYDDNTKLKGVTGGGLPAQIWKETMLRVDEGVPVRDLPMIDPALEEQPPQGTRRRLRDPARNILEQVLGAIFGQNR